MTIIKRRKLKWYGHVSHSSGLAKTILQGTVKGRKKTSSSSFADEEDKADRKKEVERHHGMDRPGVCQVQEGGGEQRKWRKLVEESSVVPQRPSWLRDR